MSRSLANNLAGIIPPFVIPRMISYFLPEVLIFCVMIFVSDSTSSQLQYSLGEFRWFDTFFLNFKSLSHYIENNDINLNFNHHLLLTNFVVDLWYTCLNDDL